MHRLASSGDNTLPEFIDDVAVYVGTSVDSSAPNSPTGVTVSGATPSTQNVSWTAASGGVDNGGYLVVRGTIDPTTAPNVNGIYAVGNTIGSGTVVFVGTGTSFTDTGLSPDTQYFYRVYTFDKAYNYSSAATANGTTSDPYFRSAASGNWNSTSTWETSTDGTTWTAASTTPTAANADAITIRNSHVVTVTASVDADQLTVASGGTLVVNGGGVVFNVVDGTGTDMTVNGTFAYAGTVDNDGQIAVNGTWVREEGGTLTTNAPTYNAGSTLAYDFNNVNFRSPGLEWSATSGPGYPFNVSIGSGSSLDLGGAGASTARQIAGSLTINGGGELSMAATPMTAPLTVLGSVTVSDGGVLKLSSQSGGDLNVGGNFSMGTTVGGAFTNTGRKVTFVGSSTQTISSSAALSFHDFAVASSATVTTTADFSVTGNWTNDGTYNGNSRTVTFNGSSAQTIGGSNPTNFAGLTINNSSGVSLASDQTVGGTLTLTSGDLTTGSSTLTQQGSSAGTTDVVGNVLRTDLGATARQFGNPHNQIRFTAGTAPSQIIVTLIKQRPSGFSAAVNRRYDITPTGGSSYTATLRLHYKDSELSGHVVGEEAALDLWRFNGTTWERPLKTGADVTENWVESSAVTQFSTWTIAAVPLAATLARLHEFEAAASASGAALRWRTAYESDNLGFNLYREEGGRRARINPELVAGSALIAGQGVAMGAGNSYSWFDPAGRPGSTYWLEDLDLDGTRTMHGPFVATGTSGKRLSDSRSPLLSQLNEARADAIAPDTQWTGDLARTMPKAAAAAREKQRELAASADALKIVVRGEGWFRVTREQLTAAGLSPTVDPARLQLYANGVELAMHVDAARWAERGAIEFYGRGLDLRSTDAQVYWLVEGPTPGSRVSDPHAGSKRPVMTTPGYDVELKGDADGGEAPLVTLADDAEPSAQSPLDTSRGIDYFAERKTNVSAVSATPEATALAASAKSANAQASSAADSFSYTVERRDRIVYYSALQNGEAENFFGKVITSTPVTQTLRVRDLHAASIGATFNLEVALQGVSAGAHRVAVVFNGAELGSVEFAGRENKSVSFAVPSTLLREGENEVRMAASAQGDVTLTEHLRLTYPRRFRAEGDRLRFPLAAGAGAVRIGGFTTSDVRVIDVTDAGAVVSLPVRAEYDAASRSFIATIEPPATGWGSARTLYAYTDSHAARLSEVRANRPSDWSERTREADLVVVTNQELAPEVEPLVARRRAEGLKVEVVNVEDLYDEFSFGVRTPQAIRDFLSHASAAWARAPRYVLLVGDGSYDPRNHLRLGSFDLVPSQLIDAGQMETVSDDWFADFNDDGIPEMAVGRLPVRTRAEAARVISKIAAREDGGAAPLALLVSDRTGSDGFDFEAASATLAGLLPADFTAEFVNRRTQDAATVRSQIVSHVAAGPSVVNYAGHGSVDVWTGEGMLRSADATALSNGERLPLFVMMTCLNGYFVAPGLESISEALLKAEGGGAFAVWASSGMTKPDAQAQLNGELYRILFGEKGVTLGDAVRRAKAATSDTEVRRTWVFFGDPSGRLR